MSTETATDCINAICLFAVVAIIKSNSGHPGAPMGQAPSGFCLFAETMDFNPANADWINRDRFVLSSGHGCRFQYSVLHLTGYKIVPPDDIKQFRKWGPKTPLHPENLETAGIEVTTGPLGSGVSNAVGLAAAEAHNAAVYNKPGIPLIGYGCCHEGLSREPCPYAGHLGLGKLTVTLDDNGTTIAASHCGGLQQAGHAPHRPVLHRGRWQALRGVRLHALTVKDGNTDVDAIWKAITDAKPCADKLTLIKVMSTCCPR